MTNNQWNRIKSGQVVATGVKANQVFTGKGGDFAYSFKNHDVVSQGINGTNSTDVVLVYNSDKYDAYQDENGEIRVIEKGDDYTKKENCWIYEF